MGVQGTIRGQKGRGVPRREKKEKKERGKIPDSMAGHSELVTDRVLLLAKNTP